jgi:hypothetical protein
MPYRLSYGTVRESPRQAIYIVRVHDAILEPHAKNAIHIDEIQLLTLFAEAHNLTLQQRALPTCLPPTRQLDTNQ